MLRAVTTLILALMITIATVWISPPSDERAMYGHEGPIEQNWLPREVAGWPAPFLADDPATSVIQTLGAEDVFRPGPFVATLSFWFLVVSAVAAGVRRVFGSRRGRRGDH